jgi:hypothetical protein
VYDRQDREHRAPSGPGIEAIGVCEGELAIELAGHEALPFQPSQPKLLRRSRPGSRLNKVGGIGIGAGCPGDQSLKRTWILGLVVGVVLAAAVGLRVYSYMNRPVVDLRPQYPATDAATLPAEPRDYVVNPAVDPAERDLGPRRIVSLAPNITEVVCALGLRDRLVGRTPYCHYPPDVETVPAVGAVTDPNYEKIRSLSPDLVLITANSGAVAAGLERLGLRCQAVPHDRLQDVFAAIEQVGQACDRPATARHLAEAIRSDLERLRREAAQRAHTPQRVLVVLGELPVPPRGVWAAGPGSFLDELVRLAGHVNAGRDALNV